MSSASKTFLSSFNRIEKWLQSADKLRKKASFTQLVRQLSENGELPIRKYENDLLQISQLRNAIVHDQISEDFVIAEPNEWILERIKRIETELYEPELVLPRFGKEVTQFSTDLSAVEMLRIVAKENYSQFPLFTGEEFKGLLTLKDVGLWFANHATSKLTRLNEIKAIDLLENSKKRIGYQFVSEEATVLYVQELFKRKATLETILITATGKPEKNLLGIIRPRDVLDSESE